MRNDDYFSMSLSESQHQPHANDNTDWSLNTLLAARMFSESRLRYLKRDLGMMSPIDRARLAYLIRESIKMVQLLWRCCSSGWRNR